MRAPAASRHFPARFRGTFRAPPSSPESAAERPFGESPASCTEYRGEVSALKAFVRHAAAALTSSCRAATGTLSTNPATAPQQPAKLFCSVRTATLESAAERARRASAPIHVGNAVGDRVILTAAGRECCRRSNDAHGRRPQVLSAIGIMITAAGGRECCRQSSDLTAVGREFRR